MEIMKSLPVSQVQLLREVVSRQEPLLLPLIDLIGHTELAIDQREQLRRAIAAELSNTGLDSSDIPNSRGLLLENLITALGHV